MSALTFLILILCSASLVFADDFKTIDGKEYKNVKVSRVEPDGLVLTSKSGISKVYFAELPKEVQDRFHYDAAKGDAYSAEQTANQEALYKQRQESERERVEEREKYWSEHATPAPQQQQSSNSQLRNPQKDHLPVWLELHLIDRPLASPPDQYHRSFWRRSIQEVRSTRTNCIRGEDVLLFQ